MVTTRRQRQRQAAATTRQEAENAGPGNQTAAAAARSGPMKNQAAAATELDDDNTIAPAPPAAAEGATATIVDADPFNPVKLVPLLQEIIVALLAKIKMLESEKAEKEAEVQKVMEENVRLHSMLDKEAQLQASSASSRP